VGIILLPGNPRNPEDVTPLGGYPHRKMRHWHLKVLLLRLRSLNPYGLSHWPILHTSLGRLSNLLHPHQKHTSTILTMCFWWRWRV